MLISTFLYEFSNLKSASFYFAGFPESKYALPVLALLSEVRQSKMVILH